MSSPRNYQTEAIIIKKTRLGEADSILTHYTPHLGKIQGFAKSLRKAKSKLAGHLELLTHSLVSLARGRNLDTIIGNQTINTFKRPDIFISLEENIPIPMIAPTIACDVEIGSFNKVIIVTVEAAANVVINAVLSVCLTRLLSVCMPPEPPVYAPIIINKAQSMDAVLNLIVLLATAVPKTLAESLLPSDQPINIPLNNLKYICF